MHRLSRKHITEPVQWAGGETIYELVGRKSAATDIHSLVRIEIPAGRHSRPHYHPIAEESYYILEGRARVEIDGEICMLEPEDTVLIRPGQHHQIWALGDEKLVFLLCSAPAWQMTDMVFLDE